MVRVSVERVVTLALAGAGGSLVTWLVLNPSLSEFEQAHQLGFATGESVSDAISQVLRLGAMLGMTIGVALIAMDEARSRNARRLALYTILGALVGAVCGMIGSAGGQLLFSLMLHGAGLGPAPNPGVMIVLIAARTLGWALIGAAAGVCPGVVSRSPRRVLQGILGGLIGGGAGGLMFDLLGAMTQSGSLSRFMGFVLIGGLVGALVSLVEEFGKEFWVTALTGVKEGRSFILAKDVTFLGRNEMADIPLFGDLSVQRQHARLVKSNGTVTLMAEPGLAVSVNNQIVSNTPLADGDIIGAGTHRFRFGSRRASGATALPVPDSGYRQPAPYGVPDAAGMAPAYSPVPSAIGVTRLEAISGPHTGMSFAITHGAIIGRDPRCDIPLTADNQASRQHARLLADAGGWRIEDGGSTNGLWVNGQRILTHLLQPGDQIGIGQTVLRVQ